MPDLHFFGRLQKVNGQLVYVKQKDTKDYEEFKKLVPEGGFVDLYVEAVSNDGNLAQLAKVHALIRDLSAHTGFSTSEIKLLVKERAGLCLTREKEGKEIFICPSFGDASKEDLSSAIQTCIEIGREVGCHLY